MKSRASSFRDPAGRLHFIDGTPVRQVHPEAAEACRAFVLGDFLQEAMRSGEVVQTRVLEQAPGPLASLANPGDLYLAHEAVPFPSFPAEWPCEMLHAAASLTLDLAEWGAEKGLGLKDATPYNVLFRGPRPVFVDVLSFETRDPLDPLWLAQGQYLRTFLLPLLAATRLHQPLSGHFLSRRDGLEPADIYRMLTPLQRISPRFLAPVSLPVWLSGRAEAAGAAVYTPRRSKSEEQAKFVLKTLLGRLRSATERAARVRSGATRWSDYCRTCSYDDAAFQQKSAFVAETLELSGAERVLDVGCNTGHFSMLAASAGAEVVAIDQDAAVIGSLFKEAQRHNLDILPLVVDFARPTPPVGWNNAENPSFLDRACGHFDCVLMLAVLHHLTVTDQIPLPDVLALAARVTTRHLVIEFVAPEDPQFRRVARGRDALYRHLTREYFEAAASEFFEIRKTLKLDNQQRWLYVMEKRNAG